MYSRFNDKYSRIEQDNQPSFDLYQKQFYDKTNVSEYDGNLTEYYKNQLSNFGPESETKFESEMPRHNVWSRQKINVRETGDICNKTPFIGDGELIMPFMDPDPRGTRDMPDMRKIKNHGLIRRNQVPFSDSDIDTLPTTTLNPLDIFKRKDICRRKFEKNFKNFSTSKGNILYTQMAQSGYDPKKARSLAENDQVYMEVNDYNHRYPLSGIENVSNVHYAGKNSTTSHVFNVSNESLEYEQSKQLTDVYKGLHSALLDNSFGDSDITKNNAAFLMNLKSIMNSKKNEHLNQDKIMWFSSENKNRLMKTYTDDMSKIKWDTYVNFDKQLTTMMNNKWFNPDTIFVKNINDSRVTDKSIIHMNDNALDALISVNKKNKLDVDDISRINGLLINEMYISEINDKKNVPYKSLSNNADIAKNRYKSDQYFVSGVSMVPKQYVSSKPQKEKLSRIRDIHNIDPNDKLEAISGDNILLENRIQKLDPKQKYCGKYDTEFDNVNFYDPYDRNMLMNDDTIGYAQSRMPVHDFSTNINKTILDDHMGEYDDATYLNSSNNVSKNVYPFKPKNPDIRFDVENMPTDI